MNKIASQISEKLKELPDIYLDEVLDFIEFLIVKNKKINDTEYLESIEGMVESIEEGRKEDINGCATLKDIGWDE